MIALRNTFLASLMFLFAGCVSLDTPQQKVFAATSAYNVALTPAVAYKQLPPCAPKPAPILCSDKSVVATVQKADNVAYDALSSAQKIVRNPAESPTAAQTAALWAQEAISAFTKIVNTLAVK